LHDKQPLELHENVAAQLASEEFVECMQTSLNRKGFMQLGRLNNGLNGAI
jgi:hypothetical protein